MNASRRSFFSDFLDNTVRTLIRTYASIQRDEADSDYFSSYESAYTLISENLPFLDEEIERLHIDTAGKSNLEIVREVYEKSNSAELQELPGDPDL